MYKRHRFPPEIIQHVVPQGQASRYGSIIASILAVVVSRTLWPSAVWAFEGTGYRTRQPYNSLG